MTSNAELRALLLDCLRLWELDGRVEAGAEGLEISAAGTRVQVRPGPVPTRWLVTQAGRTRPVPSVVALLAALRRALGLPPGARARVGLGAA